MKIIAFVGSPRRDGNTAKLVDTVCAGAQESGHEVQVYNLQELDSGGCRSCGACQQDSVDSCSLNDRLTALLPEIAAADCIVLGTPVYMLHVSGAAKNFLDRLRPFLKPDLTAKYLPGKQYITVTCSGAPAAAFADVTDYLNRFFGFYGMINAGNIIAGEMHGQDDILSQPGLLKQATGVGKKLALV